MTEVFIGGLSREIPAVCAQTDPEIFFPEKGSGMRKKDAVAICETACDAKDREACLEGALERNEEFGIWGGKTPTERKRILGERARQAS